jgi:hypothetical protein
LESITLGELLEIVEGIRPSHWEHEPDGGFEITARQFQEFASEDSRLDSIHSRVNALSNVKRAIECRIDELLYGLCLHVKSEKEEWNFPRKVKALSELGIIAPRILEKINRQRNRLEHEYIQPTKEDVEDALGVASLFLSYSDSLNNPPVVVRGKGFGLNISRRKGIITVKEKEKEERELRIGSDDGWLRLAKVLRPRDV